jgi:predicted HAD superfamily Cof-like phosphohydrolase
MNEMKSHSQLVKEFTEESLECKLPNQPQLMNKDEVKFIVRMVLSEMLELCATVTSDNEQANQLFEECSKQVDQLRLREPICRSEAEVIAEQYDAFVDAWYYMLNTSAKKGVDLDGIFRVVHEANMAKRFPDGTFHRREDGKVLKPDGWKEPDIVGEINRQLSYACSK